MKYKIYLSVVSTSLALLAGCGGGEQIEDAWQISSGLAQKGPMLRGSMVTLNELSSGTLQPNGKAYTFEVLDDSGTFKPNNIRFSSPMLETTALGYYLNELTGQKSSDMVYLRGLSKLTRGGDSFININVLTSLTNQRIKNLATTAPVKAFTSARAQAEKELLSSLYIYNIADLLPGKTVNGATQPKTFTELDLGQNRAGDQILAAISSIVVNAGINGSGINYFTNQVEMDLADDGKLNNSTNFSNSVHSILFKLMTQTDFSAAAKNLNNFYKTNYTAYDILQWVDGSGGVDKVINKYKYKSSNVPFGVESKSPKYIAGSDDKGQCFSTTFGKLYKNGVAVTTSLVSAVYGDIFQIGITPTHASSNIDGFLQRQPSTSSGCGNIIASNSTRVMKYSVVATSESLNYLVPSFLINSNGNIVEKRIPIDGAEIESIAMRAPDGSVLWSINSNIITTSPLRLQSLAIDSTGNIYWGQDEIIRKLSPNGNEIWRITTPKYSFSKVTAAIADGVIATVSYNDRYPPRVHRISATGTILWTFDVISQWIHVSDARQAPDGSIYVLGKTNTTAPINGVPSQNCQCIYLTKLESNGVHLWTRVLATVDSPQTIDPFAGEVAFDQLSNVYIAIGGVPAGETKSMHFIASVDKNTGSFLWKTKISNRPWRLRYKEGFLYSVTFGEYYDAGRVWKINTSGSIQWEKYLDTVGYYTGAFDFDFDQSGNLLITGNYSPSGFIKGFYMPLKND